jgi:hypothetical protein
MAALDEMSVPELVEWAQSAVASASLREGDPSEVGRDDLYLVGDGLTFDIVRVTTSGDDDEGGIVIKTVSSGMTSLAKAQKMFKWLQGGGA